MSILLLSDLVELNADLRKRLATELTNRGGRVAYISSAPQSADRNFFHITSREYTSFAPSARLSYFDLSAAFSADDLQQVPNFDVIHLSGGNTYGFLEASRKRGLKTLLAEHLECGGLVIGASAGAILMTPDIRTSDFCGDRNSSDLRDTAGFSFVDFLFLPHLGKHFIATQSSLEALKQYAKRLGRKVYASKDTDGIVLDDFGRMTFYGDPLVVPNP